MPKEDLLALCLFALVTSITPGPSNFMLLASGVNFGFVRTMPQVLGITIGFSTLLLGVGLGIGGFLSVYPALHLVLKIAGGIYLLYLAWRIAMSRALTRGAESRARPLTFLESAAFQWINPKAWVVALTVMALYSSDTAPLVSVIPIVAAFALVNLPSVSAWAGMGTALRSFLADPRRLKVFNIVMGGLLVVTLWPLMT